MDDGDDNALPPFSTRVGGKATGSVAEGDRSDDADELVAPGDIYATAGGQRMAIALQFIRKDRRAFTVPYAYSPLLWWEPEGALVIEYPNLFSVLLHGRELDELHRRIRDQRITWVREFDDRQAASLSAVVTRIEILRSYPSREAGDEGMGS